MKLAIILGTRPEIIKMSPIIRACKKFGIDFFILHSGQHYDHNMDSVFFKDLELPKPKYNLHVGSKQFGEHVGLMMNGMMKILKKEKPDAVIVQGDTLTVLMGALAAKRCNIPVAHHEAGLRSHDMTMPEETNRILTDHVSEYLFCPTKDAVNNIKREGLNAKHYSLTGNTIVDAVHQNILIAEKKHDIKKLAKGRYIIVTVHRAENTNDALKLRNIMEGLSKIKKELPAYDIILPMHPRTKKKIKEFSITIDPEIKIIEPVGYLEFLLFEKYASLCITDSGGLQEECSILHVPTVTIRENTERPETIKAGMNILAGTDPNKILNCAKKMISKKIRWQNVFGDGHAAERIVKELVHELNNNR